MKGYTKSYKLNRIKRYYTKSHKMKSYTKSYKLNRIKLYYTKSHKMKGYTKSSVTRDRLSAGHRVSNFKNDP